MADLIKFLIKPFSGDELIASIRRVYQLEQKKESFLAKTVGAPAAAAAGPDQGDGQRRGEGQVIFLYSGKGGVGKSLIGANLAVSMAHETKGKVALVDLDLQFGDIGVLLNLDHSQGITDLIENIDHMDQDFIRDIMVDGPYAIKVLLTPISPELADLVTVDHVRRIFAELRKMFDYIIVDSSAHLGEINLEVLDHADKVVVITSLSIPAIKNTKLALKIFDSLSISPERVVLILNKSDAHSEFNKESVEANLRFPIAGQIPNDAKLVINSINRGNPFVTTHPESEISQRIRELVAKIIPPSPQVREPEGQDREQRTQRIIDTLNAVVAEMGLSLTKPERERLQDSVLNDFLGLGPIEALINDPDITEVMVNGPDQIFIEQKGKLTLSQVHFESESQLRRVIDRIVSTMGRRIDESSPMVDARLKDGSRVNVIIPPLALNGPVLTIRKFSKDPHKITDLIRFGSLTEPMAQFIRACVRSRLNMLVSGGTGSGKTTTLNVLSSFIPEEERVVTVEDAAELQLNQEHVVTLESRPATVEGRGRIAIRDLVVNALRMRPDRIVVGECRGGEALDMLQAMNTGHDGSLTTIHANSPRDALARIETMTLMAGFDLPVRAIREQMASALDVVVQLSRLRDGSRKIIAISEVLGLHGDQVKTQDIFIFKQTGVTEDGKVQGFFTATGIMPKYFDHLQSSGEAVPKELFTPVPDPAGQGGN